MLTGIVWPHALIESPAWAPAMKAGVVVEFMLLDPPWKVVKDRLKKRLDGQPKSDIRDLLEYNKALKKKLRLQVEQQARGFVWKDVNTEKQVAWVTRHMEET